MQTDEQSETAEKHEGTPPNAAYNESYPFNNYGCPTGWNQAQPTWWNYGQYAPNGWNWGYNWNPYYSQFGYPNYPSYQQQNWNQHYQPFQQQYGNQYYQPFQQQYGNPYYQWGSQWGRPQVPCTQSNWNWNYPGSGQYGHAWGRAWMPGHQAWNWSHPYFGGQDAWWNPMRSACEYPVAA
jgi:hypothetical protein